VVTERGGRGDDMAGPEHHRARSMARGLGWASLGLGALQLSAPDVVRQMAGLDASPAARVMVPLAGVREFLHTTTLLGDRMPERWLWTRVAGDAIDLTALGRAVSRRRGRRRRQVMTAVAAVAAITAVDVYATVRGARRPMTRVFTLHAAITVRRPREEVYTFWRDLENLPRFMIHLRSVREIDERRSHWVARGPAGKAVEWDAEIVEDRADERLAWRSSDDATVRNSGVVRFTGAPRGQGTEVRVELSYEPPAGAVGAAFARLLGEHPDQQVRDDLRRFKQVMETGEVVRSEGSPDGIQALSRLRQRPAQPVMSGGIP
jgi:uncharacterized membrane protein